MSRAKARPKPTRMLWFRIRDAGNRTWRVYLVDVCRDEDTGAILDGCTDFEKRIISVSVHQNARSLMATTMHELMHAAGGILVREDPAAEEQFIQRAEYSMARMFWQLGGRFPDLPTGVKLRPLPAKSC